MCTPTDLEALALGFLFNEGVIQGIDEVVDVRVCDHGDNVDVWLNRSIRQPASWRRTSGCTGGITAVDLLAKPEVKFDPNLPKIQPAVIGSLVDMLFESQDLYRETGGVHTSGLSDGEKIMLAAEDIGRHNTLDKIAGICMMRDLWPEIPILITTGRISSEMLPPLCRLRYWETPDSSAEEPPAELFEELAKKAQSRFFTMDIAQRADGEWMIIDLGDAQLAKLPLELDLDAIYQALAALS